MESQETQEYENIVKNILNNEEFKKTKTIEHHGVNRYDHSVRVSYYSYKIAKFLRLNYIETARGGLLHDFFISPENRTKKERILSVFVHPKQALETAKKNFELTKREENMIRSHMFPINISVPKYAESWIVSTVDKMVAVEELSLKFKVKIKYAYTITMLFMINFMR
jgi:uncharacterized protein